MQHLSLLVALAESNVHNPGAGFSLVVEEQTVLNSQSAYLRPGIELRGRGKRWNDHLCACPRRKQFPISVNVAIPVEAPAKSGSLKLV